jgi:hypothetical protein
MAYFIDNLLEYYVKMNVTIAFGGDYDYGVHQSIRPLDASSYRRIEYHDGIYTLYIFGSRYYRRHIWNSRIFGCYIFGHPFGGAEAEEG